MIRRDFFKNASKRILPMMGIIASLILPMPKAKAMPLNKLDCNGQCKASCANTCQNRCFASCYEAYCKALCANSCVSNCRGDCKLSCAGSCQASARIEPDTLINKPN